MLIRYQNIVSVLRDLVGDRASLLVFLSRSVDSICSALIADEYLKSSSIEHAFIVVESHLEINAKYQSFCAANAAPSCVLFLNCIGHISIPSNLSQICTACQIGVFDSYRPIHPDNIDAGLSSVKVFDDSELLFDALADTHQSDSSDSVKVEISHSVSKSDITSVPHFSEPTSVQLLSALKKLSEPSRASELFAAIALTDFIINDRISVERYIELFVPLFSKPSDPMFLEESESQIISPSTSSVVLYDGIKIEPSIDCKLAFFAHWTLRDSFFSTPFSVARLGLWNSTGIEKLNQLFTRMEIPPNERKCPFSSLPEAIRTGFTSKFDEHGDSFGLFYSSFPSFLVTRSDGRSISITDLALIFDFSKGNADIFHFKSDLFSIFDSDIEAAKQSLSQVCDYGIRIQQRKDFEFINGGTFRLSLIKEAHSDEFLKSIARFLMSALKEEGCDDLPIVMCCMNGNECRVVGLESEIGFPIGEQSRLMAAMKGAAGGSEIEIENCLDGTIECSLPSEVLPFFIDRMSSLGKDWQKAE